jgi:hypothetical protein
MLWKEYIDPMACTQAQQNKGNLVHNLLSTEQNQTFPEMNLRDHGGKGKQLARRSNKTAGRYVVQSNDCTSYCNESVFGVVTTRVSPDNLRAGRGGNSQQATIIEPISGALRAK